MFFYAVIATVAVLVLSLLLSSSRAESESESSPPSGMANRLSSWPALLVMSVVVAGLWAFFRYSRVGIAMRATANLQTVALLMGINVKRIFALSWALSAGLAAIAGVLVGVIYDLEPGMWLVGLRSFPAVILGGLDSVFGAALGGILIGVVENMSEGYIGRGRRGGARGRRAARAVRPSRRGPRGSGRSSRPRWRGWRRRR